MFNSVFVLRLFFRASSLISLVALTRQTTANVSSERSSACFEDQAFNKRKLVASFGRNGEGCREEMPNVQQSKGDGGSTKAKTKGRKRAS